MEIDLHLTNKCNLFCKHCVYMSGDILMNDITLEDIKKLSKEFSVLGVKEIHLTGGEPLLNSEIFDIIGYLNKLGYKLRIQTNGMFINFKKAKKLKELGVEYVLISIDGLKENHNKFRNNPNSFDLAVNAAKICLECKIYTRINTVLYEDNLEDIVNLLSITSNIGVDQHSFFYLTSIGRGKILINKILTLKKWKKITNKIIKTSQKLNFLKKIRIQNVFRESKGNNNCRLYQHDNCLIMSNGDVYPCVFFANSNFKLGNIHEKPLSEIWNDKKNWNKYFIKREKNCNSYKCDGGCRGLAYLLKGSFIFCDPRCMPNKGLISNCIRTYIKPKFP